MHTTPRPSCPQASSNYASYADDSYYPCTTTYSKVRACAAGVRTRGGAQHARTPAAPQPDRRVRAPSQPLACQLRLNIDDPDNAWIDPQDNTYAYTTAYYYWVGCGERPLQLGALGTSGAAGRGCSGAHPPKAAQCMLPPHHSASTRRPRRIY